MFRMLGAVLLIIGTMVGAGILALPMATAAVGLWWSTVFLVLAWAISLYSALVLLEVNARLPLGSHLISMARQTLGPVGSALTWILYLALLYALLAAYMSAGSEVFHALFGSWITLEDNVLWPLFFTLVFGAVIFLGIESVDVVNRVLMMLKLGSLLLLVGVLLWRAEPSYWMHENLKAVFPVLTILITSFGYSIVIPSLRIYFQDDISALRRAIWIGSTIPLLIYVCWIAGVLGVIPLEGSGGLLALRDHPEPTSALVADIGARVPSGFNAYLLARLFTTVSVLTSFLGVGIALVDFLADGFSVNKKRASGMWVYVVAFVPPLLVLWYEPSLFIRCLSYAGIFTIVLLTLMPMAMAYQFRKTHTNGRYQVAGGLVGLVLCGLAGVFIVVCDLYFRIV